MHIRTCVCKERGKALEVTEHVCYWKFVRYSDLFLRGRPTWKLKVVEPRIVRWTHLEIIFSTPMFSMDVSMDCWIVKSTNLSAVVGYPSRFTSISVSFAQLDLAHGGTAKPFDKTRLNFFQPTLGFLGAIVYRWKMYEHMGMMNGGTLKFLAP